jgi:hypothetical protein
MAATDAASEPAIVGLGGGGIVGSGYGGDFDATIAAQPRSAVSGDAVGAAVNLGTCVARGPDGLAGSARELGVGVDWPTQPAANSTVINSVPTRSERVMHFMTDLPSMPFETWNGPQVCSSRYT